MFVSSSHLPTFLQQQILTQFGRRRIGIVSCCIVFTTAALLQPSSIFIQDGPVTGVVNVTLPGDERDMVGFDSRMYGGTQVFSDIPDRENRNVTCIGPLLPPGAFHVVIAGWNYVEDFADHYLWDLGLTNAHFLLYRRVRLEIAPRKWKAQCGMTGEEVLLPNRGREASAFYDYMLNHFDHPPLAVAFLHGHAANSWHTSCESVLSRIPIFYTKISDGANAHIPSMLTLTSKADGTSLRPYDWFGGRRLYDADSARLHGRKQQTIEKCKKVIGESRLQNRLALQYFVDGGVRRPEMHSCCASFVLNGANFGRIPRQLLENLKAFTMNAEVDEKTAATHCFEFIVYAMYGDDTSSVTRPYYSQADSYLPKIKQSTAFRKCARQRAGQ